MKTCIIFRLRWQIGFRFYKSYKNECGSPLNVVSIPFLDIIFMDEGITYKILIAEYANKDNYIKNLVLRDSYKNALTNEKMEYLEKELKEARDKYRESYTRVSELESAMLNMKYSITRMNRIVEEIDTSFKKE